MLHSCQSWCLAFGYSFMNHFWKIAPEDMLLYALLVYCSSWTVHLQKATNNSLIILLL